MAGAGGFPRLYAAASLKPIMSKSNVADVSTFSAALCRGLIEACRGFSPLGKPAARFPRLYAAASLKRVRKGFARRLISEWFSAALCRGLIEARKVCNLVMGAVVVFRGFMPRPH